MCVCVIQNGYWWQVHCKEIKHVIFSSVIEGSRVDLGKEKMMVVFELCMKTDRWLKQLLLQCDTGRDCKQEIFGKGKVGPKLLL